MIALPFKKIVSKKLI